MKFKIGAFILLLIGLASIVLAAEDHKPRRGKHYLSPDKVGTVTTEELDEAKVEEDTGFIDRVIKDARLKGWADWWRSCDRSFDVGKLVDAGVISVGGDWQPFDASEISGPNKEFLVKRGGKTVNPVWGRMRYVKQDKVWQAQMRNERCGVVMYEGSRTRKVIECGELDGVFGSFWIDADRFVVTAYRKISPEMSAECEAKEVGQCVAAILWLVDLKSLSVWEYRGPVVTYERCEPNDLLFKLYPEFFGQKENASK